MSHLTSDNPLMEVNSTPEDKLALTFLRGEFEGFTICIHEMVDTEDQGIAIDYAVIDFPDDAQDYDAQKLEEEVQHAFQLILEDVAEHYSDQSEGE